MAGMEDTEITLGVGKLLGLFFGLVILCGFSLGAGYWLGRNSLKPALASAPTAASAAATQQATSGGKPGAAQLAPPTVQPKAIGCASGDNCPPQAEASPNPADLTFYQAVQQKDSSHPQLAPPESQTSAAPPRPAALPSTLGTGYLVQIAAVRNQDDAKLLGDALHKQQYPVLVTQPGDKLFHVQVGPYADVKEAEAIRSRLVAAGYNAFLKR
jgi:cell division septation protein DedD